MSTITDVAKFAGVSVATVSRVINRSTLVSENAKKNVQKAIEELGYNPNGVARNLRCRKTNLIVVILPSITHTFYSKVVRGIEDKGRSLGFNVMICTTGNDKNRELLYLDMIKSKQADGAVFLCSCLSDIELDNFGKQYPAVQCSEYKEDISVPYVSINNILASAEMTECLIAQGKQKIAMISEHKMGSSSLREIGFLDTLHKHNISKTAIIDYGDYSFNSAYKATKRILQEQYDTEAIFAISDIMAMGCIRACTDAGKKVPEDIAVGGFDNIMFSSIFYPEITTISQPRYQMGEKAMELLSEQIETGNKKQENIILPHKLVVRQSTKIKKG